jgi:hypothetical protein
MCTLGDDEKSASSSSGVPLHVKLVLEWDMPAKTQVINDDTDQVEEHASVKQVTEKTRRPDWGFPNPYDPNFGVTILTVPTLTVNC